VLDANFGQFDSLSSTDFASWLPPLRHPIFIKGGLNVRQSDSASRMTQPFNSSWSNNTFNSMYIMPDLQVCETRVDVSIQLQVEMLPSTMSYQTAVMGNMHPDKPLRAKPPLKLSKISEISHRGYKRPAHRQDTTSYRRSITKGQESGLWIWTRFNTGTKLREVHFGSGENVSQFISA
jgi:hypothetical protein